MSLIQHPENLDPMEKYVVTFYIGEPKPDDLPSWKLMEFRYLSVFMKKLWCHFFDAESGKTRAICWRHITRVEEAADADAV